LKKQPYSAQWGLQQLEEVMDFTTKEAGLGFDLHTVNITFDELNLSKEEIGILSLL
jgi:hypothetical protein